MSSKTHRSLRLFTKQWKGSISKQQSNENSTQWEAVAALKQCSKTRDMELGVAIHESIREHGLNFNLIVVNNLMQMYRRCGKLALARAVFHTMAVKDVVSWTCLIMGYVEEGEFLQALDLLGTMDCKPDHVTCLAALKACTGLASSKQEERKRFLEVGMNVHKTLQLQESLSNVVIANTLVEMYCKYGDMKHAREVFENMIEKNAVSWTCLMMGYVDEGEWETVLKLFDRMDCEPDHVTCLALVKACAGLARDKQSEKQKILAKGKFIHEFVKRYSYDNNLALANALVDMYSKCGDLTLARESFDSIPSRNVASWNCLILGYVRNGENSLALKLFTSMDCKPDCITYVAALKACSSLAPLENALSTGMLIHTNLTDARLDLDSFTACALVDMYLRFFKIQLATLTFEKVLVKDVPLVNCLMLGYVDNKESSAALELFSSMDCQPNHVTYIAALKAYTSMADECIDSEKKNLILKKVKLIHETLTERGLDKNLAVVNTLLVNYGRCGDMKLARETFQRMTFKNVVTWTCMVSGYCENGEPETGLELFNQMDCERDPVSYIAALKSCTELAGRERAKALENGVAIHNELKCLPVDVFVASSLVEMYCRCGETALAREVFEGACYKDAVLFNSLITGYTANGQSAEALEVYESMNCKPSPVTYIAALKACGSVGALQLGRVIHREVCSLGLEADTLVGTALVDFYGRCSCMSSALEVFVCMACPGIVSWNALIGGYSFAGDTSRVLWLLKGIQEGGMQPDGITFVCVLIALSRAGRVEEGEKLFKLMHEYGLSPSVEHYNCLVDMLSRADKVDEVACLVEAMPFEGNKVTWSTLLGACRKWNNVKLGRAAFDALLRCSDRSYQGAACVLFSSVCS